MIELDETFQIVPMNGGEAPDYKMTMHTAKLLPFLSPSICMAHNIQNVSLIIMVTFLSEMDIQHLLQADFQLQNIPW